MIVILKSNNKMANLEKLFNVTFLISQKLISKLTFQNEWAFEIFDVKVQTMGDYNIVLHE